MGRKIYRTGNSLVVTLPKDALDRLRMSEGTEVDIKINEKERVLVISPAEDSLDGVDEEFAAQVGRFIEEYYVALEEIARAP
jgi:putative addiction module antidote